MNDNLKLKFLLVLFLNKRNQIIIFLCYLIPLIITVFFIQNRNESQIAEIEFNKSNNLTDFNYNEFNVNSDVYKISNHHFLTKFAEVISNHKFLNEVINEIKYLKKDQLNINEDYENEIRLEASRIKLIKPIINRDDSMLYQSTLNPNYRIIFESKYLSGRSDYVNFYLFLFHKAAEEVYNNIESDVNKIIKMLSSTKERNLDRLNRKKEIAIQDIIFYNEDKIRSLRENLEIAKSLNLQSLSEYALDLSKDKKFSLSDTQYFLVGSNIINAELQNYLTRLKLISENPDSFASIYEISKEIKLLNQKDDDLYLRNTFNDLFDDMKSVSLLNYDVNKIRMKDSHLSKAILLFLSIFISTLIVIIFLFFRFFQNNNFDEKN